MVAWALVVGLTVLFWQTRTTLLSEVAQLKEFSTASESETFQKISKMNDNIASKNGEIAELNKSQRALHKSIKRCEDERSSLTGERDSLSAKLEQLATELVDTRKQAEKYRQECHEVVQAKDTAHVEKDARIQHLQEEINKISEQLKAAESNTIKDTSHTDKRESFDHDQGTESTSVPARMETIEEPRGNTEGTIKAGSQANIKIIEEVDQLGQSHQEDVPLKQEKKGRKKNLGMLKEHMGVGRDDA